MQTIKTYIKKVKLVNPITLFKNWFLADIKQTFAELNNDLSNRVDKLENVNDFGDIEQRLEDVEYYDLYDIQERAENAERKASDNENEIESIKERSETNQESIKHIKNDIDYCKEYVIENRLDNVSCETFNKLVDRVTRLENSTAIERINNDVNRLDKRFETLEGETSIKKIREIVTEVLCDKGLQLNLLDDRVDYLEELAKKYLNAELEAVALKQEKIEANLSAMQKLSFEICKYYGGDFNLDDFNNCYDIIKKYDINLNGEGGKNVK